MTRVGAALGCAGLVLCAAGSTATVAGARPAPAGGPQVVHVIAEVTALDFLARSLTLVGSLGGEISVIAAPSVANLDRIKVGDVVRLGYYEALVLSASRTSASGPRSGESAQGRATVRVLSIDTARRRLVVEGANGKLFATGIERPELFDRLAPLREGDQLDVVMTRAVAVSVSPATPGLEPTGPLAAGTLVIDRGDVLKQVGNTLLIRNERGRTFKVTVDPRFKFLVNGQVRSVYDLWPGVRLLRTSFRVLDVEYVGSP